MKYTKWIDKNIGSLKGKTVIVTGATGGIGFSLLEELDYLDATVIMAIRNKKKADVLLEKVVLKQKPIVMSLDLETYSSIDEFINELKQSNLKVDYLINNAGVYNMKSRISEHNHEIHMQVNTFSTIYLTDKVKDLYPNIKVVNVNSISSYFSKIDEVDITNYLSKNAMKRYGATKKLLMHDVLSQRSNSNILIHPGIVFTPILISSWPKILKTIFNPVCKLIFMDSHKAALIILYAMVNDINYQYIVAPRGLFNCWGYPKEMKIKKSILKTNHEEISKKIRAYLN